MNKQIIRILEYWRSTNTKVGSPASMNKIFNFEKGKNLALPDDLREYFNVINGTLDNYDENFFQFYSLNEFKSIPDKFKDWEGIPNYKELLKTFPEPKTCFVFADQNLHLFSYAIRLYEKTTEINEVYVLCGGDFKVVARSFNHFMELYLNDPEANLTI